MILEELNPAQQEAVSHEGGPLLVLAPAGSGKTRVVIARLLYLLDRYGWSEDRLLVVTFTRKAARELLHRISRLRPSSRPSWVGTFHSVAARMLRQQAERLDLPREFTIVDGPDQLQMIRDLLGRQGVSDKEVDPKKLAGRIGKWKSAGVDPVEAIRTTFGPFRVQAELYAAYQDNLALQKALDFDDLLLTLVRCLEQDPEVRETYQRQFEHILVDEYQDTNPLQERLLRLLSRDRQNVTVVGDDDQSIYRFRGAEVGHILSFPKEYPGARQVVLTVNYRSTRPIVTAASSMISSALARYRKDMVSTGRPGEPVFLKKLDSEWAEARFVARTIQEKVERGAMFRDQVVLFRMNVQAQPFIRAFAEAGIPFQTRGAVQGFFNRREIRDLLAYLRVSANPFDRISLGRILNVPPRGMGEKARERLDQQAGNPGLSSWELLERLSLELSGKARESARAFANDLEEASRRVRRGDGPFSLLQFWLSRTGYEQWVSEGESGEEGPGREENLKELLRMSERFGDGIGELTDRTPTGVFLEELALSQEDPGEAGESPDRVSLLTIHQAKGLEFPHVYLAGAEEDILPMKSRDKVDVEEERRLFYVAMTRARDSLAITWCLTRQLFGRTESPRPSRFLRDIPPEAVQGDRPVFRPETPVSRQTSELPPRKVFPPPSLAPSRPATSLRSVPEKRTSPPTEVLRPEWIGKTVVHPRFGRGRVEEAHGEGGDLELSIRFESSGVRRLLERFANLQVDG
ncbi:MULTISPECIES: ATP-dependent helicase [Leptospirillum]|jgi:DNA helicase-2/ATP-dependent DNA helicase PcrA|uniref:ATP-dependent helicase n=1 Tax=Leptospirillum TaxID=179 RepID=UPI0000F0CC27|nr:MULTISPECIES: UvrD-helicase domain-containing protein [Leptospirillum]AKS24182.1 hypothetical protein ABH19_11170 [Leptospirillum sp. Group II 'CF-1']EAY56509.1 MAG: putative ATP-dependent DNA helicase, UvrD/REP family [Leptospirillum rubarum]EIJ75688.1 MAG: Putative ATP-dependent DNA helicase, UvrD/REP family [Leptospirillum sp. Group II 'C75']OOH78416.1 hypothetical protein BOX30_08485 [Leptospirillum ferriphilum]